MKPLYKYLKEEAATPANTPGMGNPMMPSADGEVGSEPLVTAKSKKQKKCKKCK